MTRARNTADTQTASGGPVSPSIAGKNAIINGGMDIWQRGTSIALNSSWAYMADRWTLPVNVNQTATVSRQLTSDTTNLPNIQYCARVQRNSGSTGTGGMGYVQTLESINSKPYIGQVITLSFYARKGANFSPTGNALTIYGMSGTGTDETRANQVFTGEAYWINNQAATLTSTWQRFTFTGTVSSAANQIAIYIGMTPTGTASTNDYFEITGVQLELGSVATPFSRAGGTIQGELAACQRYFQSLNGTSEGVFNCNYYTTVNTYGVLSLKQTMRIAPTLTASSSSALVILAGAVQKATTAISLSASATDQVEVTTTTASSTTGYGAWARFNGSGSYLQFSAEL